MSFKGWGFKPNFKTWWFNYSVFDEDGYCFSLVPCLTGFVLSTLNIGLGVEVSQDKVAKVSQVI